MLRKFANWVIDNPTIVVSTVIILILLIVLLINLYAPDLVMRIDSKL
jgi:hypothetical protein